MSQHQRQVPVVLGLGGNIGDVPASLQRAVELLSAVDGLVIDRVSSVHRTAPWGPVTDQPDFCNIVVLAHTTLAPLELLHACQRIELDLGRVREVPGGPRTMDIDVVAFGELVSDDPELLLPHPRAHLRGFVLAPWLELDEDATIPGRGRVADLLRELP